MDFETAQRPHRVTALFQDAQLSFDIARKATLAQLVEQLSVLGEPRWFAVVGRCSNCGQRQAVRGNPLSRPHRSGTLISQLRRPVLSEAAAAAVLLPQSSLG